MTVLTPAEEIRDAASKIRECVEAFRAEAESTRYWQGLTYSPGVITAMGGAGGNLAALFTPEAAEELAAWLESWDGVGAVREDGPMGDDYRHAVAFSRAVNAATGGA